MNDSGFGLLSFLQGIQRFIWGKISDWDRPSVRSRRTAADAGERCESDSSTSTLGVYNSWSSLTATHANMLVNRCQSICIMWLGVWKKRTIVFWATSTRALSNVLLLCFPCWNINCFCVDTMWVFYCFRKPLIGCVEKQLLGEHITAILQKGEMLCLKYENTEHLYQKLKQDTLPPQLF